MTFQEHVRINGLRLNNLFSQFGFYRQLRPRAQAFKIDRYSTPLNGLLAVSCFVALLVFVFNSRVLALLVLLGVGASLYYAATSTAQDRVARSVRAFRHAIDPILFDLVNGANGFTQITAITNLRRVAADPLHLEELRSTLAVRFPGLVGNSPVNDQTVTAWLSEANPYTRDLAVADHEAEQYERAIGNDKAFHFSLLELALTTLGRPTPSPLP